MVIFNNNNNNKDQIVHDVINYDACIFSYGPVKIVLYSYIALASCSRETAGMQNWLRFIYHARPVNQTILITTYRYVAS